ncbi:unnamed protein product [Moneuplotes crassus]|uniref:Uncharacterized protein n=1 Tax=Euplotes crassus TaxID=5936 RepID=A0AAD1UHS6_EUPCR|nr:unnamed protein product [Moneuplotes crassus]
MPLKCPEDSFEIDEITSPRESHAHENLSQKMSSRYKSAFQTVDNKWTNAYRRVKDNTLGHFINVAHDLVIKNPSKRNISNSMYKTEDPGLQSLKINKTRSTSFKILKRNKHLGSSRSLKVRLDLEKGDKAGSDLQNSEKENILSCNSKPTPSNRQKLQPKRDDLEEFLRLEKLCRTDIFMKRPEQSCSSPKKLMRANHNVLQDVAQSKSCV